MQLANTLFCDGSIGRSGRGGAGQGEGGLTPHASQQLNEATEEEGKAVDQLIRTLLGPLGSEPLNPPPS
jgi:prepilin-type processing-associated H-X9-DG protein